MRWTISLLALIWVLASSAKAQEAWQPVAPMDWAGITPADFDDSELEIPYLLHHFHRLANAVVETGEHRGFLDLAVNREPRDNKPYNARILENNLALAYFYVIDRPWNRYRGDPAVKVRLEAMLDFWCRSQNPESGLFAEYSTDNWSMAPTGFGVVHMSRTIELLTSGGPTIAQAVLDRTLAAQRKAVMALLTRDDMFRHASGWSNQLAGVYRAALVHLKLNPDDAELRAALLAGAKRAVSVIQSPAGFLFEASGMDIGYSSVHERFIAYAYHLIEQDPELIAILRPEEVLWGTWLSYNLLRQPGEPLEYFVNGAAQTRTSHAWQELRDWPQAQHVESWRAFMMTNTERAERLKARRASLETDWPRFPELVVPSAFSYQPSAFFTASTGIEWWVPTRAQRDASIAMLPYVASDRFTRRAFDPKRAWAFDYVRRPGYYAAFVSGKPQQRQGFGLGILWNDAMGTVVQGVAGTANLWGTRVGEKLRETEDVAATIRVNATTTLRSPGWTDLPAGDVSISYALPAGEKSVVFGETSIDVSIQQDGAFVEQIPLLIRSDDRIDITSGSIVLARGDRRLVVTFDADAVVTASARTPALRNRTDYQRVMLTIANRERLTYSLRFE
jgi:hypothetical protein